MLDTSELFKANFRNMEALKKINILNDLSKVNFGFKETTNRINESLKRIYGYNDLFKVNFGIKETLKNFLQMTEIRNQLLLSKYKNFDVFKNNSMMFVLPNLYRKLNTIHKFNLNLLTQNYAKATKPELRVFEQDIISTELALQSPLKQEQKEKIENNDENILLSDNARKWLNDMSPSLDVMHKGILYNSSSNCPDKTRQVFVSLRTLSQTLLNEIAPLDRVKKWINNKTNAKKSIFYNSEGKFLERKSQIAFFFRQKEESLLKKFFSTKNIMLESIINQTTSLHKKDLYKVVDEDLKDFISVFYSYIEYIYLHYKKYN